MKLRFPLIAGALLGITVPQMAAAQSDPLTAKKLSCVPDKFTRCAADNKCETREASERDKATPLIIDAETKQVVVRREDRQDRAFGTIVDDKVAGDVRTMSLREPGDPNKPASITLTITRAGKLTMTSDQGRRRAEATCSPAT